MDKLKMHTPDLAAANIERLAELFPACVTENRGEDGTVKRAIDFDLLRQELSDHIVDGPQERYRLDWPGKREALLAANAPIAKTLRPCREESVDFDTTQNLFIEGDNLDALKLLQETYLGKVKMIYIDPPYNTGKDFIYEDDFAATTEEYLQRSNQLDEEGRLVANTETNGRFHSDWLSMMFARLRLARSLLNDFGVLAISIDDNEASNLKKLCDEIFGGENFVASLAVQSNPRGRHLDLYIAKTFENVLLYVKDSRQSSAIGGMEKTGRMLDEYDREDADGKYRFLGLRNRNQAFNPQTRPNLYFPLYVNVETGAVAVYQSPAFSEAVLPTASDGTETCWTWGKAKIEKENNLIIAELSNVGWRIFRKDYLMSGDGSVAKTMPKSLWMEKEFTNDYGRKSIKELFGKSIMDFPKSPALIENLVKIGSDSSGIVLDFFAGSGTAAQAVMSLNAEDGGIRRSISVQLAEPTGEDSEASKAGYSTIAEIAKERIRRAGQKIKSDNADKPGIDKLDIGFRVLKIDTSNMAEVYYTPDALKQVDLLGMVDNVRAKRSSEDLLFQVLLDWGVDLTLPIGREQINGREVFFVDGNALAACFAADGSVDEPFVKELAKRQPLRVVFRDAGFANDNARINVEQIFKTLSPATEVKTL